MRTVSDRYSFRLLHLCREVTEGRIDLETFEPVSYWAEWEAYFEKLGENMVKLPQTPFKTEDLKP